MMREKEETEGGWRGWRKLRLMKKVVETPIHTSFYFAPEDGSKLMTFLPGQFISIRIPGYKYFMVRNYSLSSSSSTMYRITVKKEKDGQVSSYLHNEAKEGDVLEIGVPCGDFVADDDTEYNLVFIGAGIGITPLLSMLRANWANKVIIGPGGLRARCVAWPLLSPSFSLSLSLSVFCF